MEIKTVGFIGLGNMGLPMALNLIKAGYVVKGFDMSPDSMALAAKGGISACQSAKEAAQEVDVSITMLPNGSITLAVYDEILEAANEGTIFIDSSTIDVASSMEAHEKAKGKGMKSLDAPVSGGVGGATEGTLTFMIGGDASVFEACQSLFMAMGKKTVYCGGASTGQVAKTCNNMQLGISMIGACEAFLLAEKLGLNQKALFEVMSTSTGQCWSINTYCPVPGVGPVSPADNGYQPGFSASLMLKDLLLAYQAAKSVGAAAQLGELTTQLYQAYVDKGEGDMDFSGIIQKLPELADKTA